MRKLSSVIMLLSFILIHISCEESPLESQKENIRTNEIGLMQLNVDHYLSVAYGPFPGLFHITQQGEQIEKNHWQIQYDPITNFDFEWGYRYRLLVNKEKFEPMMDGPAYEYKVVEVLSRERVDSNEQFKITLKQYYDDGGSENFVEGGLKNGYSFLRKDFDCGNFCDKLSGIENIDKTVIGTFQHREDEITLVGLKSIDI